MKFRLKEKVGSHSEGGKVYHAGDVVESKHDLITLFPNKFDRVMVPVENIPPQPSEPHIPILRGPSPDLDDAAVEPLDHVLLAEPEPDVDTTDETGGEQTDADEKASPPVRRRTKRKTTKKTKKAKKAKRSRRRQPPKKNLGENVTDEFEAAVESSLFVFNHSTNGFSIVDPDEDNKVVNPDEKLTTPDEVNDFIERYLES